MANGHHATILLVYMQVAEIQDVCPDVTEEEAAQALIMCNNRQGPELLPASSCCTRCKKVVIEALINQEWLMAVTCGC